MYFLIEIKMKKDIGMAGYEKQVKQEFYTHCYIFVKLCRTKVYIKSPSMKKQRYIVMENGTLVSLGSTIPIIIFRNDFLLIFGRGKPP